MTVRKFLTLLTQRKFAQKNCDNPKHNTNTIQNDNTNSKTK